MDDRFERWTGKMEKINFVISDLKGAWDKENIENLWGDAKEKVITSKSKLGSEKMYT